MSRQPRCSAICEERYAPRYSDSYGYVDGHITCQLPQGHGGSHRFTYEWEGETDD